MAEYIFNVDEALYDEVTGKMVMKPKVVGKLIRCKDCKHHHPIDYCDERDGIWNDNDYCSFAERQEE